MTVFEIASLPAKSSSNITNSSHEEGAALQTVLDTLTKQPGFRSNIFGKDLTKENICYIITGWKSLQDHETFIASEQYKPFFNAAGAFLAGPPMMRHVDLPSLEVVNKHSLGRISTVQIKTWSFPLDVEKGKVEEAFKDIAKEVEILGGGWVEEEVNGGRGFAALSGWHGGGKAKKEVENKTIDDLASGSEVCVIDVTSL